MFQTPREGARVSPDDVQRFGEAPLYDPRTLRTVFLQFERTNWEDELAARYHTDKELPATVTIDGTAYRDVGVRFRGNSSYRMVPAGLKRSLNLSFDAVHADQNVGGYNTLNLLNANGDPTFVRTALFSEIARDYLPAPKVNFVRVVINGESWGVYVNVAAVQQGLPAGLRSGPSKGARWKVPGSPAGAAASSISATTSTLQAALYEIKSKDDPKAWTALVQLCRLLNRRRPRSSRRRWRRMLDIDGALKFLALDIALVNSDGYWTRASDYSLFQDERGRFHVLPHDFNEALGVQGGGRRGGYASGPTLDPLAGVDDLSKPLRARLLAVPALRQRYLAYVRDIAEKWMDWNTLAPLVRDYQSLIEADVKADGRKLYGFDAFTPGSLQRFFEQRRAYLLQTQEGNP